MLTGQMLRGLGQNIAYSVGIVSYSVVNLVTVVLFVYVLRLGLLGVILSNTLSYVASAVTVSYTHLQIKGRALCQHAWGSLRHVACPCMHQ